MADQYHRYGDAIADIYDRLCLYQHEVPETVDFITTLCPDGGSVLEFGIGTGRLAVPLAERGLRVHGIEASQKMLDQLAEKDPAGRITATVGDIANTRVEGTFDLVLIACNTLSYLLEQDQQAACLRNAAAHLAEGGRVVVDQYDPSEFHSETGQKVTVHPLGPDETVIMTGATMRSRQLLMLNQSIYSPGGVRNLGEVHRYCWPSELDLMARLAGLSLLERWEDWRKRPVQENSSRYISVYGIATT